jgi:hypothetical protein
MEKVYKNIVYLFIVFSIIILVGFYKTYFAKFPDFEGLKVIHHIHGFTLALWLTLLIAQPLLIRKRKYKLHKALGKFSYVVVPFILIFMLLVYKNLYLKAEASGAPHSENLAILFLPLVDTFPFMIYYTLAIINRRNIAKHMRYMILTAVIVLGPGLSRIFSVLLHFDFFTTLVSVSAVLFCIFIGLIVYDRIHKKHLKPNPYVIGLVIFLIPNIAVLFIPKTIWWQTFAEKIVLNLF